ncbi:MAG TPA: ATP-binding cassette domain-containing protein [Thermoplasmata archaeon]|nr:ATP-binding cassette domain-containing protein [Thermoplasmata archaeon]
MTAWRLSGLSTERAGFRLGPVDLALAPGETVAVLGRSGAGKTTLLRMVAGFQTIASGSVRRDEDDVTHAPPEARGAVYVPQGLGLFPHRTVRRNVAYPLELRGGGGAAAPAVRELLDRFGLAGLADRRPPTLSSGEQQRVALARALAAGPKLLLWDEPLGALDLMAREELLAALASIRARDKIPMLLVTHDPTLALSLADRWLLLDAGRAGYLGPVGPLVAAPPDPFAARFVGYENVYAGGDGGGTRPGFLGSLADRFGPGGLAVGVPTADAPSARGTDRFLATVDRVEPGPAGCTLAAVADAVPVRLRLPPGSPVPRRGESVSFRLAGVPVAPIGGARAGEA